MSLIFSSGGGRLGNQLLNLIHLSAISYEYSIDVYKVSDLFTEKKVLIYCSRSHDYNFRFIEKKFSNQVFFLFLRAQNFAFYIYSNIVLSRAFPRYLQS